MNESQPIVCTLTAADLADRERAWTKLLASGLVHRDRIPGGIRLRAAPGAGPALVELIDLERECCAWIQFEVAQDPVTGTTDVALTADADGQTVLVGMFVAE